MAWNERHVVDASVVVKWFVQEDDSRLALQFLREGSELIAPTLLLVELANTLWLKWRRSGITAELADSALEDAKRYFSRLVPTETLLGSATQLSRSLNHPIYDCCYLALAINENAALVTADRRLLAAASRGPQSSRVVSLATAGGNGGGAEK